MFEWVKARRTALGVTQKLLSTMTGIPRHYISQIENGQRELTSIQHMVKIVKALNAEIVIQENL
jgi:transcriptional regulator with XRE-family HTH domain